MKNLTLLVKIFFIFLLAQPVFTESEQLCTLRQDMDYRISEELILLRNEVFTATSEIERLQNEINEHRDEQKVAGGDLYTRWGRRSCPDNGTSQVYTGFMAGSNNSHSGTGSNYICLSDRPTWDHYSGVTSQGKITGVEYQFWHHRETGAAEYFGDNMFNHNAPCAVCYTKRRVAVMLPGRNKCYDGWTTEYEGYLVSGPYSDSSATEYVCLDRRPEKVINGDKDDDDNRLYLVEGTCGESLSCPPYEAGRELTCVVCSL